MISSKGVLLCLTICLFISLASCRRNHPSLIDTNQPPDTELWYAPPDSTDYEYLVHLYWRGLDRDGAVEKYIWVITDTINEIPEEQWNPSQSLLDYQNGRLTAQTDSVFSFTAFKNIGGVGLKKNLQAFHVAAIDDNGIIDETPAAIEFVATIDKLPEMTFATVLKWAATGPGGYIPADTVAFDPANLDTVGMYKPFAIMYDGKTINGEIREYKWFPISNVELEGAHIWTTDLTDNYRFFLNDLGGDFLSSGVFRFAAQCKDDANAESVVDAARFTKGVCQVVVNFDPDTEIYNIINIYKSGGIIDTAVVDFSDAIPDTVPFRSWITLSYNGWDSPNDIKTCTDDINKCISYQVQYHATSTRFYEINFNTGLLPPEGGQDTNPCSTVDSTSMNIGTVEYDISVRSMDENGRLDGRPESALVGGQQRTAVARIVGNFNPTLDSLYIEDHLGRKVMDGDTLKWKWAEIPPQFVPDDTSAAGGHFEHVFTFAIRGFGHDHPKELDGSGVKTWYYSFASITPPGIAKKFARATSWVAGSAVNELNDQFTAVFPHALTDINGQWVFEHPPNWIGVNYGGTNNAFLYEMRLKGRDTDLGETISEYIFLKRRNLTNFICPPDPNEPISERKLQNDYPTERFGRWTGEGFFRFYFQLVP